MARFLNGNGPGAVLPEVGGVPVPSCRAGPPFNIFNRLLAVTEATGLREGFHPRGEFLRLSQFSHRKLHTETFQTKRGESFVLAFGPHFH